ncbi:MAG: hypothetical protein NW224_04360 [Leptolyngbyaceae cyanobacterium bins.302]|nr:hypothetical protein [Leptolyngbyaceae cyanobacterium bins.302]
MKLEDIVQQIVIDPRKLVAYALDLNSLKGSNKAKMFQQHLGFTPENYQLLLEQVQEKVMDGEAIPGDLDEYGQRYSVDLTITGAEPGQQEIVRTGWIVEPDAEDIARLTTIFIRSRR